MVVLESFLVSGKAPYPQLQAATGGAGPHDQALEEQACN